MDSIRSSASFEDEAVSANVVFLVSLFDDTAQLLKLCKRQIISTRLGIDGQQHDLVRRLKELDHSHAA